jgi:hypothetical protein
MGLFGGEKITMMLEGYNYKPGDTIKGNVKLNLKKPIKARKMEVAFIGRRKEQYRKDGKTRTRHVDVFNFTMPLGPEKEYQTENFDFEIKIPSDLIQQTRTQHEGKLDGKLGQVVAIGSALAGQRVYPIEWMVHAQLDIPMKFDVKKTQKIILSED